MVMIFMPLKPFNVWLNVGLVVRQVSIGYRLTEVNLSGKPITTGFGHADCSSQHLVVAIHLNQADQVLIIYFQIGMNYRKLLKIQSLTIINIVMD